MREISRNKSRFIDFYTKNILTYASAQKAAKNEPYLLFVFRY